ncbi:MAG: hypothetical protein ACRDPG_04455 [Nocardioidaceae bacterium]
MTSTAGVEPARWDPREIYRSPALLGLGVASVLSLLWVFLPPSGSDLAAQVAHANFFAEYGWLPVDMRWFGGTSIFGYSIICPPLMAWLGVSTVGVLSTVAASSLLGLTLTKCAVPYPRVGVLLGTGCLVANLVVGRLTFAVGLALALGTALCLWLPNARRRMPGLVIGMILTWAASPLAALFLAMTGVALAIRGRRADGSTLAVTAGLLMLATAALGQGGVMPMSIGDAIRGLLACVVVAFVTRYPLVRLIAALCALVIVGAFLIPTPVGVNAVRLPALLAVPIAVATSRFRWRVLLPTLVATLLVIPPMTLSDAVIGQPSTQASYFTPLERQLSRLTLTGRVEIVPTQDRWEAAYVANDVPLARGWMTQLDKANNNIFFQPRLTAFAYQRWLRNNGVQYVALSDATPSAAGAKEQALIERGPSFLRPIWSSAHWELFAVRDATDTVEGAHLVDQNATQISFLVQTPGRVLVRVHWSQWLTLTGPDGCIAPTPRWTKVVAGAPGLYVLSSGLLSRDTASQCPVP